MVKNAPFRVGISPDFRGEAAGLLEPVLQEVLAPFPWVVYDVFPANKEVSPDQIADFDAVITLRPRFTAASFSGHDRLAVISRWGVGYDMIDVRACTEADVLLAITSDAVRRPVAEAIVTLLLALAKALPAKDRLVRTGGWQQKGQIPKYTVNREVVDRPGFQAKLRALRERWAALSNRR